MTIQQRRLLAIALFAAGVFSTIPVVAVRAAAQEHKKEPVGFEDTPYLPNQPWRVHDIKRPHPAVVTPADKPGGAPSDAIVLFDGKDLSHWQQKPNRGPNRGKFIEPTWPVKNGYFEVGGDSGDLISKEKFGDAQYHVEWSEPETIAGESQARGNSGFIMMSRYEIQVLDSFRNLTYADGQAGAIYGQWPPLANAVRKPGEWNVYDIAFEAPVFENGQLKKPAYVTVFVNGVLVHHHKEIIGAMVYRQVAKYTPHEPEEPLMLQDHHNPVRYRNIWVRKLKGYDQPEK